MKFTQEMREHFGKIAEALRQLENYMSKDDLARIEFYLSKLEDELQELREEIREVLVPKPKKRPVGRPPKNAPRKTEN